MAMDSRFEVAASFCEGQEKSLLNRTLDQADSSKLQLRHALARQQSEDDLFGEIVKFLPDHSHSTKIPKGSINDQEIVEKIEGSNADLLVCYGSSLIASSLLQSYKDRFLNVHLGISPYYRGSGTNIWPLINNEPDKVGATFMYLNDGIDTGEIIHQVRADIHYGDTPHSIGNRLIKKMTRVYADIVANFAILEKMPQPKADGKLYRRRDFTEAACLKLYDQFQSGIIEEYLDRSRPDKRSPIIENTCFG